MAILYIAEFAEMEIGPAGRVGQMPMQPPLAEQTVAIGASSTQCTNPFNAQTRFVRLHSDVAAQYLFGTNPTALKDANGSARMAAGQTEYHGVPKGQSFKVAVLAPTV